ncbi:PI-PLC X domain-containing protein 2-like [Clytia hemisphaerica]
MTRKSFVISGEQNVDSLISPKEETGGDSFGNSRWMSNLPSHLTKISLNRLAIPGSHNSGAYSLNPTTPMSPDKSKLIKTFGNCNKQFVINWSLCQSMTITEQLNHGVRYFDMRPGFIDYEDDFFFVHGVHGVLIRDLLHQMRQFLDFNPREVILVDFNHFHSFDEIRHKRLVEMIHKVFDSLLVPRDIFDDVTFTLSDLWRMDKRVILSYKHEETCSKHNAFWFSRECVNSPWFNTNNISTLKHRLNELHRNPDKKKFNVYQAILTARKSTIALRPTSTLRQSLVRQCNNGINEWLDGIFAQCKQGFNIVMCDFVCEDGCVEKILRLNKLIGKQIN